MYTFLFLMIKLQKETTLKVKFFDGKQEKSLMRKKFGEVN